MKNILLALLLFTAITVQSQQTASAYSSVKVFLDESHSIKDLAALGIAVDHGFYTQKNTFTGDLSSFEKNIIQQAGFAYEILIEDVTAWYANPNRQDIEFRGTEDCGDENTAEKYPVPENFELGEMGGYFTWQEMLTILDDMKERFPNLISTKQPIEGELSYEGRPIHWVRISDQPETDEDEPEVLYTALHHSREPASLSQMIFYMWYLLENYDNDEQIQFLVDNTEMYFIPCVNPDGYVYNQINNPDGGGLWRKNRAVNGDGSFGVDLNRNYGYQWGFDNEGSSGNTLSETYRGTEAFSEPETRAVRNFCNAHQFQIALNYHTHGNLLIYPWGYSDSATPDNATFTQMADAMITENQYLAGTGTETVGYTVNGDSDDWMYGEQASKPSIFSFTPEVGATGGFWPSADQIIPNCRNTMLMNLNAAALLHRFGVLTERNSNVITNLEPSFNYTLDRIGLQDGPLTVTLSPVSDNILSTGVPQTYSLALNESVEGVISYSLDPEIQNGETVELLLSLSNGDYTWNDTISKIFISDLPLFSDANESTDNWQIQSGIWDITDSYFYSAPTSITDSPNGVYENNIDHEITLDSSINLNVPFDKIMLYFWARWDIEAAYDYAQVALSVNGGAFIPLCGKYTSIGTNYQDEGNPLYDGKQEQWVQETIDITEYVSAGDLIKIRFSMISDGYLQKDGFYFDDLEVFLIDNTPNQVNEADGEALITWQFFPNPADQNTFLEIKTISDELRELQLTVYNPLGQVILEKEIIPSVQNKIEINTKKWEPGLYFCQLKNENGTFTAKPLLIIH